MHFRIDEILKEKGKTRYWLYIQLGLSYQNFKKIVENEVDIKKLYGYLIGEFTSNQYLFTQCRDYLIAHQFLVPLKNELGEIVKGNIYISKETAGYFEGIKCPSK